MPMTLDRQTETDRKTCTLSDRFTRNRDTRARPLEAMCRLGCSCDESAMLHPRSIAQCPIQVRRHG